MNNLTILNTGIRRDAEGRYCLNDCHKASGGAPGKRPGEWLRIGPTLDLIDEVENAGITAIKSERGRYGGTYVVKELVYAYAMWISPKFHLHVIRAFDALVSGQVAQVKPKALPETYVEALRALLESEEAKAALQVENAEQKATIYWRCCGRDIRHQGHPGDRHQAGRRGPLLPQRLPQGCRR